MFTVSIVISHIPGVLILIAWLVYMINKKTGLSIVLFACHLIHTVSAIFQTYFITFSADVNDTFSKSMVIARINMVTTVVSFIYGIAFFIFIKHIVEPKELRYQFLDDSKSTDR